MARSLLLLLFLLLPASALAEPFVERLDPPVLQRGRTTRLRAVGTGLDEAVGLWTSLGGKIEARPARGGGFDVRVAADAPVGVFGLRVASPDGLGNLHLCLIDDLPARPAAEGAALPCALWGRFREGESDTFEIEAKAGQSVSFEAVASRLGKEVDPLVSIRDAKGKLVAERDNDPGLFFDCRFAHRFARAGKYAVSIRDARYQGHPHGSWVLRMGQFPAARVAVPAAVRPGQRAKLLLPEIGQPIEADIPASARGAFSLTIKRPGDEGSAWLPVEAGDLPAVAAGAAAKLPAQLCGVLGKGGSGEPFRLLLEKGQALHAVAHGRRLDSSIDLELALADAKGRELGRAVQGEDDTARLDFTAPAAGTYLLQVRDAAREGGPACAFRVEARSERAPPAVVAEIEGLAVPRGDWQPVPLVVKRNGDAGPIFLSLEGAPAGVALSPTEIPAGKDAIVCRLAATGKAALGMHNLRIWGRMAKGKPFLVRARPLIDRQRLNVDLIPYALREDQRRLPATVSGEVALMVTEPAPFSFGLEQSALALARYQHAPIPLATTRAAGFAGPIAFTARGGQLADKAEGRTRVYAQFPQATPAALRVAGSVHSRILANLGTARIEVRATALHRGRRITLARTFDLEIRPAFALKADKKPLLLAAGGSGKAVVRIERMKTFAGPVTVALSPPDGLECPDKVVVPAGKDSAEVQVRARADARPGRHGVALSGSADVDGFEEEARGRLEVDVPKR